MAGVAGVAAAGSPDRWDCRCCPAITVTNERTEHSGANDSLMQPSVLAVEASSSATVSYAGLTLAARRKYIPTRYPAGSPPTVIIAFTVKGSGLPTRGNLQAASMPSLPLVRAAPGLFAALALPDSVGRVGDDVVVLESRAEGTADGGNGRQ